MTIRRGTLTVHTTRFLEEDVHDGDYPRDDTDSYTWFDLSATEAVRVIRDHGLTFESTGSNWAGDPDGSYISDYRTGQRTERSAHLSDGWPERVVNAIMAAVDA